MLDAATVWRSLCRHAFQMGGDPDLARLLVWAATVPAGVARYRSVPAELRDALRERLIATLGSAAGSVLDFIAAGYAEDALALGVVCGVVFSGGEVPEELREAAARLERFHGNAPVPPGTGAQLGQAAREALGESAADPAGGWISHLTRADQILREVRADHHAYRSDLTPLGLEQRLERFAQAIQDALGSARASKGLMDKEAVRCCEELARAVGAHAIIQGMPVRLEPVRMATRLLRWLAAPAGEAAELGVAANRFRDEHAFADWARDLLAGGDDHPAVSAAYRGLEQAVRQRRQAFNRSFATLLAAAGTRSDEPPGVVLVERFLDTVLASLAEAGNRLLVVVLDGMSWAVAHELLEALEAGSV